MISSESMTRIYRGSDRDNTKCCRTGTALTAVHGTSNPLCMYVVQKKKENIQDHYLHMIDRCMTHPLTPDLNGGVSRGVNFHQYNWDAKRGPACHGHLSNKQPARLGGMLRVQRPNVVVPSRQIPCPVYDVLPWSAHRFIQRIKWSCRFVFLLPRERRSPCYGKFQT